MELWLNKVKRKIHVTDFLEPIPGNQIKFHMKVFKNYLLNKWKDKSMNTDVIIIIEEDPAIAEAS